MLDRLLALEPGVSARAERRLTQHAGPVSQVFLIEALAQLGGIAAAYGDQQGGFLAAIEEARFGPPPQRGDTLLVTVRVLKSFGRLVLVEGEVDCGESRHLQARMALGLGGL